jgi:DNA-binding transcriptional LysR family regulator
LFRQDEAQLTGRIRVDLPNMTRGLILPSLPSFMDAHPLIELEISATDRQVDLLAEGFDCVLRVGAQPDQSVVAVAVQHADDQLRERGLPATLWRAAHWRIWPIITWCITCGRWAHARRIRYLQGNRSSAFPWPAASRSTAPMRTNRRAWAVSGLSVRPWGWDELARGELVAICQTGAAVGRVLALAGQRHCGCGVHGLAGGHVAVPARAPDWSELAREGRQR